MADWLGVSATARRLDVSAQTVRDLADAGKLPVLRTASGQRLFEAADVERVRRERRGRQRARARKVTRRGEAA
jgi:excisionase family DNA binding protein